MEHRNNANPSLLKQLAKVQQNEWKKKPGVSEYMFDKVIFQQLQKMFEPFASVNTASSSFYKSLVNNSWQSQKTAIYKMFLYHK